ncbi:membrane protein US17 [Mandrillus leucophaeus cytomegalovirus]|uniref:Membrane protein US17 n=1 Tax=Mandrillus leucophaeus cytomegalovirus TaxID=1654930 RepID=A0A0G2UP94_9BETA|nr:membrane protein US17 [Mandrillus leucophaeus cytomegalovirus]AKI29721.1 membrane protein US17 [Mandrillus leucophaeus cytomegalovirus]
MTNPCVVKLVKQTQIKDGSCKVFARYRLFTLRLYRTVSLQASCTFIIAATMLLLAPYLHGLDGVCQTGFLPALSLLVPNACLTVLHAKKQHSDSWSVLTSYTLVTSGAVVSANLCVEDIQLVTWAGLLAGVLFVTCTGLSCLGSLHYNRWRLLILVFLIFVGVILIVLSFQSLSLPNKILLGYYVIVLAFMLGVTAFDTSQLFEVSSIRETHVLGLCLYEDLVYCYLLILLILTTESSLAKLTNWMQQFSVPNSEPNKTSSFSSIARSPA